ncbi:MAG: hypothetical protein ACI8T1_000187 [Verrucomicrobiales bacterium]|jgi:hypothetical protein
MRTAEEIRKLFCESRIGGDASEINLVMKRPAISAFLERVEDRSEEH